MPRDAPIVVGIDETIEGRRGAKIAAKGIYRDPVRSSKAFFVKTSGLGWGSMMMLVPISWARRVWALPFLRVLAPIRALLRAAWAATQEDHGLGEANDRQLRRWLPDRYLVVVADSSYAVLELLACAAGLLVPVTVITRLRLDAALYDPLLFVHPGPPGARARKVLANRHCKPDWLIPRRTGRDPRWFGMVGSNAWWKWQAARPFGIKRLAARSHPLGFAPRSAVPFFLPKHCSAPIRRSAPPKSLSGLSCGGRWS